MKKIVFCLLAAVTAHGAFAGYAWYSENVASILTSLKIADVKDYPVDATLWGSFAGDIWTPPSAKYSYVTGKFEVGNTNTRKVTSYIELNNLGKYDVNASLANFMTACGDTVKDEFDQPYVVFDSSMSKFYKEYEYINYNQALDAFDSLQNYFNTWRSSIENKTVTVAEKAKELAETADEIDKSFGKAKQELEKAVKDTEKVAEDLNKTLLETKTALNKIQDDAVLKAQTEINRSVTDFNSFINKLETAIELKEWDDTAFEAAYDELTKSEQDLVGAITELQKSSGNEEAQQAIYTLSIQLQNIRNLKGSLRTAITNKDKNAARSILAQAKNTSFYDSRKAAQRVNNKSKELKSKADALNVLVNSALSTMDRQCAFVAELKKLRCVFATMFITSMDNFHRIGSYLCSTNSMEYLNKRAGIGDGEVTLQDFTVDELMRWIGVSMQEPLFRNMKDQAEYQSITKMTPKSGYGYYNNIMRFLSSSCFMTYFDLETANRFESAYQTNPFLLSGFRGFREQKDMDYQTGNYTTNWYANNITAPKNWADGTSIIVTNGVFKSGVSYNSRFSIDNGKTINNYYRIGGRTYSASQCALETNKINCLVITISGNTPSASYSSYSTLNALQQAEGDTSKYIIPLYTLDENGKVSCDWRIGPNASMGEF